MRKNYLYETLFVIIAMAALFTGLSLFSYNDADGIGSGCSPFCMTV